MTTIQEIAPAPATDELLSRFQPIFDEIAAGAVVREEKRDLAYDAVARLRASGFSALRVPLEYGGLGATLSQSITLLSRLGEADSNLVQALRAHFATVEVLRVDSREQQERWYPRIVEGAILGNATTERGNLPGKNSTVLTKRDGKLFLNGTKYYSTGSLYADYIKVHADTEDGKSVRVVVHRSAPGLELVDDWDGFGQRLTASGTTHLRDIEIKPAEVEPYRVNATGGPFAAYAQLILLTALTGVGRAARRDAVNYVRTRTRAFTHGVGSDPQRDPLIQEVVGRVSATIFGVESALKVAAEAVEEAFVLAESGALTEEKLSDVDTLISEAQIVIVEQVLDATNRLFEVGGASATSESRRLDRHWRNARVIGQHNPIIYRAREVGQQRLTGDHITTPVYVGQSHEAQQNSPTQKVAQ